MTKLQDLVLVLKTNKLADLFSNPKSIMTKHIPLEHYGDLMETIMIAPKLQRTSMPEKNALVNQKDTEDVLVGAKLPLIPGSHLQLFTRFLTQRVNY